MGAAASTQAEHEELRAAVAAPLPTLKDWALPTKLPCSCVQCTTAQNFLNSPTDIGPKEMRGISFPATKHTSIQLRASRM